MGPSSCELQASGSSPGSAPRTYACTAPPGGPQHVTTSTPRALLAPIPHLPPPWGWAPLWKHQPTTAWSLVVEQTLSLPVRFRGASRTGDVHAPCRFGSTEDITEERMTTSGSWMPQLLVLSPRSGGPSKESTGGLGCCRKRQPTTARPVHWANSARFWRGIVPSTASSCWTWDGQKVGTLGQFWEFREGPWA